MKKSLNKYSAQIIYPTYTLSIKKGEPAKFEEISNLCVVNNIAIKRIYWMFQPSKKVWIFWNYTCNVKRSKYTNKISKETLMIWFIRKKEKFSNAKYFRLWCKARHLGKPFDWNKFLTLYLDIYESELNIKMVRK